MRYELRRLTARSEHLRTEPWLQIPHSEIKPVATGVSASVKSAIGAPHLIRAKVMTWGGSLTLKALSEIQEYAQDECHYPDE